MTTRKLAALVLLVAAGCGGMEDRSFLEVRRLFLEESLCGADCMEVDASVWWTTQRSWWVHRDPDLTLNGDDFHGIGPAACPSAEEHCLMARYLWSEAGKERIFAWLTPEILSGWLLLSHDARDLGSWPGAGFFGGAVAGSFRTEDELRDFASSLGARYESNLPASIRKSDWPAEDERIGRLLDGADTEIERARRLIEGDQLQANELAELAIENIRANLRLLEELAELEQRPKDPPAPALHELSLETGRRLLLQDLSHLLRILAADATRAETRITVARHLASLLPEAARHLEAEERARLAAATLEVAVLEPNAGIAQDLRTLAASLEGP